MRTSIAAVVPLVVFSVALAPSVRSADTPLTSITAGTWAGKWVCKGDTQPTLPLTMQIESVQLVDGNYVVAGHSEWGKGCGAEAGSASFKRGEIDPGDVLVIARKFPVSYYYAMQPDGSFLGRRLENGAEAGTITLTKQ